MIKYQTHLKSYRWTLAMWQRHNLLEIEEEKQCVTPQVCDKVVV
jgi:hypothetical protein